MLHLGRGRVLMVLLLAMVVTVAGQQKQAGSLLDELLEVQAELGRISELRADERIKQLKALLGRLSDPKVESPVREMLLRARGAVAELQLKQQRPEAALAEFRQGLSELQHPVSDRLFSVAIAFPAVMLRLGYREEAILLMRDFESICRDSAERLRQVASFYLSAEAADDALRVAKTAVELKPDAASYRVLAVANLLKLRLDDALQAYEQVIKLDPKDDSAYAGLANIYRAEGEFGEAISLYRKQLEVTPQHESARAGLAVALLLAGQVEEAAIQLAAHFAGAGREFRLYSQLAYLYAARRDLKSAKAWAQLAMQAAPAYAWARIAMANVLVLEGDYNQAEELLSESLARGNSFPTLLFELVKVLVLAEDYEAAYEQAAKFISINEESEFEVSLAGSIAARSRHLKVLLEAERKAALALPEDITSDEEYRLVEGVLRFNSHVERLSKETGRRQRMELQLKALDALGQILSVNDVRKAFRKLWIAERLLLADFGIERAADLVMQAMEDAEVAVLPEGALRDLPDLDLVQRRSLFRARAHKLLARIRFKQDRNDEAKKLLEEAIQAFPEGVERRGALWQLAVVLQAMGKDSEALEMYIKAYDRFDTDAALKRQHIESLYRKLHEGSLEGLKLE
ncbi:MAG: tetratricopeptide repeat protein [Acidobacteriota bacterium]|nr:tetratricopeptide repeat protein [Blastocatellia bacterium]MDW8412673.1 tetratricopeptide repeat protein [Acidobacteriota bacterium]